MDINAIQDITDILSIFKDESNNILIELDKQKQFNINQILELKEKKQDINLIKFIDTLDTDYYVFIQDILNIIIKRLLKVEDGEVFTHLKIDIEKSTEKQNKKIDLLDIENPINEIIQPTKSITEKDPFEFLKPCIKSKTVVSLTKHVDADTLREKNKRKFNIDTSTQIVQSDKKNMKRKYKSVILNKEKSFMQPQGESFMQPQGEPFIQPQGGPFIQPQGEPFMQPQGGPFMQPQGEPFMQTQGGPFMQPQGEPFMQPQGGPFMLPQIGPFMQQQRGPFMQPQGPFMQPQAHFMQPQGGYFVRLQERPTLIQEDIYFIELQMREFQKINTNIIINYDDIRITRISSDNTVYLYRVKSFLENIINLGENIVWRTSPDEPKRYNTLTPLTNSFYTEINFNMVYNKVQSGHEFNSFIDKVLTSEFTTCNRYIVSKMSESNCKYENILFYYHDLSKVLIITTRNLSKIILAYEYFYNLIHQFINSYNYDISKTI